MESNNSAEKSAGSGTKTGLMRRPEEGNQLWQLYQRLPRFEQGGLRDEVTKAGVAWSTFLYDSKKERALFLIPFFRLDLYRAFLNVQGLPDLFDLARQERTTQAAA